ncbi:MAG: hypothetical protein OEY19_02960 [Gammaproteobacteria bacterium]|nr:hypothetical protein [Gammaproteobacteria bacterium]MDH5630288.1 hypothetical protein [Gammaproteobacteria bacterium]
MRASNPLTSDRNNKPIQLIQRLVLITMVVLSGCAGQQIKEVVVEDPVFYPSLPQSPRIQYLKTLSSLDDLTNEDNSFGDFLFDEEDQTDKSIIQKPYGVGFYDGAVFVVDTRGPGYVIFDLKNQKAHTISGHGMQRPINIAFDEVGNRYIADGAAGKILIFNSQNKFVRSFSTGDDFKPTDVLIKGDKIYVVETQNHRIQILAKNDGRKLTEFGKPGSKEGELYHPTNIKLDNKGNLYIVETGNFRIQKFTENGQYISSFGKVGTGVGQMARPKGIALDNKEIIYSVDSAFSVVQMFQPDGKLLLYFGGEGEEEGKLLLPADIEISYDNLEIFQKYAHPDFVLEYVIAVTNQFGPNSVVLYGFGKMKGMDYINE